MCTFLSHEQNTESGGAGPLMVTIRTLPDEVLLEIFEFYVNNYYPASGLRLSYRPHHPHAWITLTHVCQGWRHIVLTSPRRLHLQLVVKGNKPVKEMLNIWSALPIVIWPEGRVGAESEIADNVLTALEHRDLVRLISFDDFAFPFPSSKLQSLLAMMQHPFPALTDLRFSFSLAHGTAPIIPDSFLGGSAPHLQTLSLSGVVFPVLALSRLLLTAGDLVRLSLRGIPISGYFSPEAIVSTLSNLTRLELFYLEFLSPRSHPPRDDLRPHPMTRTVLAALTHFHFKGVCEYLEDLVVRIDTPLLGFVHITFFNQLIFNIPQLSQFVGRSRKLEALDQANVTFWKAGVDLSSQKIDGHGRLVLRISCTGADWQLSSVAQVCSFSLLSIPTVENLTISNCRSWKEVNMEHSQWLELFYTLTTVRTLCLLVSEEVGLRVASALQEIAGEDVTQVLPALQVLSIPGLLTWGPMREAVGSFAAARQRFGRPIAVGASVAGARALRNRTNTVTFDHVTPSVDLTSPPRLMLALASPRLRIHPHTPSLPYDRPFAPHVQVLSLVVPQSLWPKTCGSPKICQP